MAITKPAAFTGKRMTEEEFMRLPDDGCKYELVDGEPKEVPTSFEHDFVGGNVVLLLGPHTRGRGFMTIGQAGFRMKDGNIRCPDVSFTLKSRLPDGKPSKGFGEEAPDLCIEIISPSEEPGDVKRKLQEYFAAGARIVWHMFPESQTIPVFTSPTGFTTFAPEDEIDGGDLLPDFRCRVSELFALE
jgi:Uma2 family endonuclease